MNINAFAAYTPKDSLKPFSFESRELESDEVEVKITHCGICHSDLHLIDNDWGNSKYPLVPGHEILGIVVSKGVNVHHLNLGDRVGIGWQSKSCHNCEHCNNGHENFCKTKQATAIGRFGGFAERIIVDSGFAFLIPSGLESEHAAPLLCAGITVFSPFRAFNVLPQSRVGVIGIGGLGHLAIQFASKMGCEVTAFSTSDDKKSEAIFFGASHFVNSTTKYSLHVLEDSFDFILSTVTAPLDWSSYIKLLRTNGRLNFVGGMVGNLAFPPGLLIGGNKSVSGSNTGGSKYMKEMLSFAEQNSIAPQIELFPLSEVNSAVKRVRENSVRYRVVLDIQ